MRTHEERSALTARWLACGLALLCVSSVAQGAVVNLQTGPRWCAVTNAAPTLSWDWSWEWVPVGAVRARVVVSGGKNKVVHDATYAKPATSAVLSLPVLSAKTEDVYAATLQFLDTEGEVLAARTAQLDVLCGAFPSLGVEVRTAGLDTRAWEKAGAARVVVPYEDGYSVVRGSGRVLLEYFVPGSETPKFSQYVNFATPIAVLVK